MVLANLNSNMGLVNDSVTVSPLYKVLSLNVSMANSADTILTLNDRYPKKR
jgi:hypothetical protein